MSVTLFECHQWGISDDSAKTYQILFFLVNHWNKCFYLIVHLNLYLLSVKLFEFHQWGISDDSTKTYQILLCLVNHWNKCINGGKITLNVKLI